MRYRRSGEKMESVMRIVYQRVRTMKEPQIGCRGCLEWLSQHTPTRARGRNLDHAR